MIGGKYVSTAELRSGYNQVRIKDTNVSKVEFRIRYGQSEYLVAPFRLTEAPGCFLTLINDIFRPYWDSLVLVYPHDIPVYSKSKHEQFEYLDTVIESPREHRIYDKVSKRESLKIQTQYLGLEKTEKGIQVGENKITSIRQ